MKEVYVVTGRPSTVDRWKLLKAFATEELAEKYIEKEEAKDKNIRETEGIEYYDIEKLDLVTA